MPGDFASRATDGDPAQGNLIPDAQYLSDYTFSTVGGGYEPELRLRIVRVLVDRVDLALHFVLAKHLEDIEVEAKDRSMRDLAGQAKQLRISWSPGWNPGNNPVQGIL